MKQEEFRYQDVIDLGFIREDVHDPQFFKQYGYQWFIVEKELFSGIVDKGERAEKRKVIAEWECKTRYVRIYTADDEGNILGQKPIKDLDELKSIMKMFGKDE